MKINNKDKNIVLIGFMGSGKTSVGKRLSLVLKREFIDTDDFIEKREGMTINEIFKEKGEEEFLKAWALMPGRLQSHLDSLPLPADFKKSERKRLYYVACHSLLDYPLRHARLLRLKSYSPGERYYRKVSELLQEDPSAHEFWEYRQFFRNGIHLLGERKKTETGKPLDKLKCELE